MKKLRYISIHQPWPFQLLFLPFSLEQSFFPLNISVLNFSRSMRLHSPVATMLRFIKFPFWRQQNYWSMLSPLWSKAECVCGCECAPSSIVASFKLEAFLTRTGDLARQNKQPHHMRNTRSRKDKHTHAVALHPKAVIHTPGSGCILWVRRQTTLVTEYTLRLGQIPSGDRCLLFWH